MAAYAAMEVHNSLYSIELYRASIHARAAVERRDLLTLFMSRTDQPDRTLLAMCDYRSALAVMLLDILASEGARGIQKRAEIWDLPD